MRHVISILIENEAGALSRVVGLFSQRGYNIESLTVAPTDDKTLSRCTISTEGSSDEAEQITKQKSGKQNAEYIDADRLFCSYQVKQQHDHHIWQSQFCARNSHKNRQDTLYIRQNHGKCHAQS